jgi:hypothetical protein
VKTQIVCDSGESDKRFDQRTFYSYTKAGRIADHTVKDDSSRIGQVTYTYDKNGHVTRMNYPTGSSAGAVYTYGNASASNDEKVVTVARDTTTILSSIAWFPFGGLSSYTQQNAIYSCTPSCKYWLVVVTFARNLAYRLTSIVAATSGGSNVMRIDYAEDARGRYTKRDFSYGSSGQKDMFFLDDNLSRVTCRTPTSVSSCPTSGTTPLDNISYNASSDRDHVYHANAASSLTHYLYIYGYGDQLNYAYEYPGLTWNVTYSWNSRGNRTWDDDTRYGTNDKRTYTIRDLLRHEASSHRRALGIGIAASSQDSVGDPVRA